MTTSIADIKRVFIDTSAWIDLMNSSERYHAAAVAFHKSLAPMTLLYPFCQASSTGVADRD